MPGICDGKLTLFKSGALPALGRFATAAWSPICDASYLKRAASESMNLQKSNRRTPGWSLRHPQVLRLRALPASDDFDAYWEFHEKREYERNHAARYADHHVPETVPSAASLSRSSRRSALKIVKKKAES